MGSARGTLRLFYLVVVACLGNNMPMGYIVTSVNVPQFIILKWIRQVRCSEESDRNDTFYVWNHTEYHDLWCRPVPPEEEGSMLDYNTGLSTLWAIIGSAVCAGSLVGVWPCGWLLSQVGNKNSLYISNILAVIGTLLCSLCTVAESVWMLIVGRFFLGLFHGLVGTILPVYIAEISPVKWRGALLNFNVLCFFIGLLTAILVGLPSVLGSESLWTFITWSRLICVVFTFATLPFCPESPVYLMNKKRHEDARNSLKWLRGTEKVEDELNEIQSRCDQSARKASVSLFGLFEDATLRKTTFICIIAMLTQQLTGFSAIITYSTAILSKAELEKSSTIYGTIALVGVQIVGVMLAMFLMERAGRRPLMLIGTVGCILANLAMVACVQLSDVSIWFAYGSFASLFFFMLMFTIGPGTVPWIFTPEMFPDRARGVAMVVITAFCYAGALATAFAFPIVEVVTGVWIFAIFAGLTSVGLVYVYFTTIETKGKPYSVIELELRKKFGIIPKDESSVLTDSPSLASRC